MKLQIIENDALIGFKSWQSLRFCALISLDACHTFENRALKHIGALRAGIRLSGLREFLPRQCS